MRPNVKQICELFEIQQAYQSSFNNERNLIKQTNSKTNISNLCLLKIFIKILVVSFDLITHYKNLKLTRIRKYL